MSWILVMVPQGFWPLLSTELNIKLDLHILSSQRVCLGVLGNAIATPNMAELADLNHMKH